MGKSKRALPVCSGCNSNEALYITLANGEKLPKYTYNIATGNIYCQACDQERKRARA